VGCVGIALRARTRSGGEFCALHVLTPKLIFFTDTAKTAVPNVSRLRPEPFGNHRRPIIIKHQPGSSRIETAHTVMRSRNHMTSHHQRLLRSRTIPTRPRPTTQATPQVISISGRGRMKLRWIKTNNRRITDVYGHSGRLSRAVFKAFCLLTLVIPYSSKLPVGSWRRCPPVT